MKKQAIILAAFTALSLGGFAQQLPQVSFQREFQSLYNPAYNAEFKTMQVTGTHVSQWVGFDGAPNLQVINFGTPIKDKNFYTSGTVFLDRYGPFQHYGLNLGAAYEMRVSTESKLAFGLSGLISNIGINSNEIKVLNNADNVIQNGTVNELNYSFNAGALFTWKGLKTGLSVANIGQAKQQFDTNLSSENEMHYYSLTTYDYEVDDFTIIPRLLLDYTTNNPLQAEFGSGFNYNKKIELGIYYKTQDALITSLKLDIKKFTVGYAAGIGVSKFRTAHSGTHQVLLGYRFGSGEE